MIRRPGSRSLTYEPSTGTWASSNTPSANTSRPATIGVRGPIRVTSIEPPTDATNAASEVAR